MIGLTPVLALLVGLTLIAAGSEHLSHPRRLLRDLRLHRMLSPPGAAAVAFAAGPAEFSLGLGCVVFLIDHELQPVSAIAQVLAGLVFVGYSCYSQRVLLRAPTAPCGCSRGRISINVGVVVRAAALSVAAGVAAVGSMTRSQPVGLTAAVLAGAAGAPLAGIVWLIPASLHRQLPGLPRRTGT